jgi:serine/threonine-protein kinase
MTDIRAQRAGATLAGVVFGNYRILGPLERGGMGSVYRAEHAVLGRPAAVKILRPELTTNPQLVQRFLNEAKAATMIRHPGIVEVYDYGTTPDGTSYLVMELLSGSTLAQRLAERGRLPEIEAAFIARGIASALRAAHREGIVHRDLKPANIFLIADHDSPTGERVKVLDFGIAKLIDPSRAHYTQTGALIGTPVYMAPEQARAASAIDHRADLYALGCVFYEMLVGQPPFVAAGAGELIALHLFTPPAPPSGSAQVSPEVERIVLRLLEKEPQDRFQNGGEVIDALDAVTGFVPRTSAAAGDRPLLADERLPDHRPSGSSMGLIAGLITLGIAAAIALFVVTRGGGGDDAAKAAGSAAGSATETEAAPPPKDTAPPASTAPPSTQPSQPSRPQPRPSKEVPAPPTAAEHASGKPRDAPPSRPVPGRSSPPRSGAGGSSPSDSSGPVTRPDTGGPVTSPDGSGPITSPGGLKSPGGGPINPGESLGEDKKPPPPKPAEPSPPPPPPTDKLPDKPTEGAQ